MRVIKHFIERDERSDFVSHIFDSVLAEFKYPWKYDCLELYVRDENKAKSDAFSGIVVVDYNHPFVVEKDEKGVRAIILSNFFRLLVQRMYGRLPKTIEDIITYKQMAKKYPDLLEYIAYNDLLTRRVRNLNSFITANSYWLAFKGIDNYSSEMLRKMVPEAKKEYILVTRKVFSALEKNLSSKENIQKAVQAIREIS